MALRSGYKGFKKLLGLKTIRPGTLAVDDVALANTFFPRSEQAVLGTYNLYPKEKTGAVGNASVEILSTGIRVSNSAAGTYKASYCLFSDMECEVGNTYTLEADVTITSGAGLFAIRNASDQLVKATAVISQDGHYKLDFTMSADYKYISLFSAVETSEVGNVKYENLTLSLKDAVLGYEDYSKTNRKLTKELELKQFDDSTTHIKGLRSGNVVTIFFENSSSITAEVDATFFTLPEGFRPSTALSFIEALNKYRISIATDGKISSKTALSSMNIRGCVSFVTAS